MSNCYTLFSGMLCHLYFDLEFNKRENADKNGDEMVDLLIQVIFDAVREKYCLEGNNDWVVELDSSNEDGGGADWSGFCSRRVPIHCPQHHENEILFKRLTISVGAFVTEICSRISSISESDGRFRKLFVSKDSSSIDIPFQLFVDKAVYSRNRCFRLALSSPPKQGRVPVCQVDVLNVRTWYATFYSDGVNY
ncbi:hypothetical protein HAX54_022377 [Datura stramonium]|uniref:DNA-directed primase/polymerase protein n=1 Tax=Datura stramonium TaxID=4076 RepID=A0ABS8UWJ2_DATST|nr:hypothetical protein [Datura stramonium]